MSIDHKIRMTRSTSVVDNLLDRVVESLNRVVREVCIRTGRIYGVIKADALIRCVGVTVMARSTNSHSYFRLVTCSREEEGKGDKQMVVSLHQSTRSSTTEA